MVARGEVPTEHAEQRTLMEWAALVAETGPRASALHLLHSIPNGGARHKATAGKLRAEGVKAGVPDLCLPCPRPFVNDEGEDDYYAGLYIEMKRTRGGRVSEEQAWWHEQLRAEGYRVEVCRGWVEAAAVLCEYLGLAPSLVGMGGR